MGVRAVLRNLYELYKLYIFRRPTPAFTADEKELALLRLEQEIADFKFLRQV